MNEAIKLAIEKGGYVFRDVKYDNFDYKKDTIVLDPKFWQSLGRALGWGEFEGRAEGAYPVWKWQGHRYFDLILTGGDTDKFWKELL